jgi:hypothetical protein
MRLRRRHAVQIAIALVLSVALYGVLLVWMPYQREMRIANRISELDEAVGVRFAYRGPDIIPLWARVRIPWWNRIHQIDLPTLEHFLTLKRSC